MDNILSCQGATGWLIFMQRFHGIVQADKMTEVWYTGTHPNKQRFSLRSCDERTEGLHVMIDFRHAANYWIFKDGLRIEPNEFDLTTKAQAPVYGSKCGENRFTPVLNHVEFYLTCAADCVIYVEKQDSV